MLELTVITADEWDEEAQAFHTETLKLELEHSLVSLSKWEEIWKVPLLAQTDKTTEQALSYIECMCLTPNVAPEVFQKLTAVQHELISEYINEDKTATWFNEYTPEARSGESITAELVYYWMNIAQCNWEAQYWHLSRLLTLLKIHTIKSDAKPKKMGARESMERKYAMNEQRLQKYNTTG